MILLKYTEFLKKSQIFSAQTPIFPLIDFLLQINEYKFAVMQHSYIHRPFVLSGGGARGFAHLGVLKAFRENGILPEVISATSAGSIIGALYCDGFSEDEILEISQQSKQFSVLESWRLPRKGLLSIKPLMNTLQRVLRAKRFEDLSMPLYITTTDFRTGDQIVYNSGDLIPAICAACSIPVIFSPVIIDGIPQVDGGMSSNLPIEPLEDSYHNIIGVHVNPIGAYEEKTGFIQNIDRTIHLGIREPVRKNIPKCAMFIEPEGLEKYGLFDAKKGKEIVDIGYSYTKKYLRQLQIGF